MSPLAATCEACGYRFGSLERAAPAPPDGSTTLSSSGRAPSDDAETGHSEVETGPCRRCGEAVLVEARFCRHCGHTVREWRIVPVLMMIVGFCLTASIIGAVVGIPMQIVALRLFREAREGTVVVD